MIGHFGAERSPQLPDVPTAKEQGFDVQMTSERGIAAPRDLPDDITLKFSEAMKKVLDNPEFQKQAKQLALPLAYLSGRTGKSRCPIAWRASKRSGTKHPGCSDERLLQDKRGSSDILAGVLMVGLGALSLWAGRDLRFAPPP